MRTPIRYSGGKSKAFDFISTYIPFWPRPKELVSPFLGGGSMIKNVETDSSTYLAVSYTHLTLPTKRIV